MRVKIKGEITAESIAAALQVASEEYEKARPGHKIYGANLYLNAFDANGLPFEIDDGGGEPLTITIEAKPGELVKPALTAEGERHRIEARNRARQLDAEADAARKQARDARDLEWALEFQKSSAILKGARKQFDALNSATAEKLKSLPERFAGELNGIVQGVWDEIKPIESAGKKRGQAKALPVFSIQDGELQLFVEEWKRPRRLSNPAYVMQRNVLATIWTHAAWVEVVNRIDSAMQPPGDVASQPAVATQQNAQVGRLDL